MRLPNDPSSVIRSLASVAGAAAANVVPWRPDMPAEPRWYSEPVETPETFGDSNELRAMYLGVTTVALTDGETTLMFDGFFSRPSIATTLLRRIQPDHAAIGWALHKAKIESVAAVLVAHSHYDHAMDAPAVAWRSGAKLVGSESTLNIGRGFGLNTGLLTEVDLNQPMKFGRFSITTVLSDHSPKPKFRGAILEPLGTPAHVRDYRVGECYSFIVTHTSASGRTARLLMHASAGFLPDCLAGQRADVAFLGIAPIGKQSDQFRADYWRETVEAVGVRRVFPTHWDDFTVPLTEPLVPMPYIADNLNTTLEFLAHRRDSDGIEILFPKPFVTIDPLKGIATP